MTAMNEEEYQAHSKKQEEMHTVAQQNFSMNVANMVSIILYYVFMASFVVSGLAVLYVLYGDIIIHHQAPQWVSTCTLAIVIVGIAALNLSYKFTNVVIKYTIGYYEMLYTEKVLLPLRIMSVIFLIAVSAIIFLLPGYPVWAGISVVISYRALWVAKITSVPLTHYMFG